MITPLAICWVEVVRLFSVKMSLIVVKPSTPRTEPTSGLLRRWLTREGHDAESADLLDALNSRIDDADFRIGPSYLMKRGVYREGGLERTWRTKILPLLEEYHYGEGVDVEKRYGLAALRESSR